MDAKPHTPLRDEDEEGEEVKMPCGRYRCHLCPNHLYSGASGLWYHMKRVHGSITRPYTKSKGKSKKELKIEKYRKALKFARQKRKAATAVSSAKLQQQPIQNNAVRSVKKRAAEAALNINAGVKRLKMIMKERELPASNSLLLYIVITATSLLSPLLWLPLYTRQPRVVPRITLTD